MKIARILTLAVLTCSAIPSDGQTMLPVPGPDIPPAQQGSDGFSPVPDTHSLPFHQLGLAGTSAVQDFALNSPQQQSRSWMQRVSHASSKTENAEQRDVLLGETPLDERRLSRRTAFQASSYVPVGDSWIYPAFDRLAAVGALPSSTTILRPWTRFECARLLADAHATLEDPDETTAAMLSELDIEFRYETAVIDGRRNSAARGEDAYTRVTGISGMPLRDGFHFASTVTNDFGRPFGHGINSYDGIAGHAQFGPMAVYARGEFQYASSIAPYSVATQTYIGNFDLPPFGWNLRFGNTVRFRPLELYGSLAFADWQLSFGQQSLWWGPDRSTSLVLSNNAEPLPMIRLARAKPIILPGFLNRAGPVHVEFFLARQGGIHYVGLGAAFTQYGSANKPLAPPPYIWGFAATIKPSEFLEVGFAHTVIFAGYGRPMTLGTFFHTFSVDGNGQALDPGKRVTEFSFAYHPPFVRKSLVLYTEAMAWDDPVQGKFVGRYAFSPGMYVPRIPKVSKLDLRLEAAYTDLPKLDHQGFFYNNAHYIQGYTNYGQILGSWVGPQGIGGEAASKYWFSPRTTAGVSFRKMVTDTGFFQGGNRSDAAANIAWTPKASIELSGSFDYGHWKFAAISPASQSDFTTTVQLRLFQPRRAR